MKDIFAILAENGIEVAEESKTAVNKALLENYKTVEEVKKIEEKRDHFKSQLETAQDALKDFEGVDVGELKGKIATLTNDIAAKETEYQGKLADMEFDKIFGSAVNEAKPIDPIGIQAHFDIETLKASKNQKDDIKAAFEKLKADKAQLFVSDEPYQNPVKHTGTPPPADSATDTLRAAMGLK